MTSTLPDLSRVSLNEIIFEGRNQAYGAFELRRVYDTHLKQATALTILLCLLAMSTPFVLRHFTVQELAPALKPTVTKPEIVFSDEPVFEPVVPVAQTPPPASTTVSTSAFPPPRIVADTDPIKATDQPTMAQLNTTEVGATTVVGTPGAVAVIDVVPTPAASGTPTEEIFTMTQEMPSYPGGYGELLKYLGKNMKYPALALRNSVEGKVYVKFVVDETGQVVSPVVLKGIGGGCDEEALRVVRSLPRFTPGMQNGRAVKVYFNLPITFKMLN